MNRSDLTRIPRVWVALSAMACGDAEEVMQDEPDPENVEIPWTQKPGHTLPVCEETEPAKLPPHQSLGSTLQHTLVLLEQRAEDPNEELDPATEYGEAAYLQIGFGTWELGDGEPHAQRALDDGAEPGASGQRRSLAWSVVLSDLQLTDDESPLRDALDEKEGAFGYLRPHSAYLPRAMSAMNRTLTEIEQQTRDFDFGVVTGDCTDSAQNNELRWVIDLMDGASGVHTDSGADDDPVPGPDNDPKDPFDAVAFPAPWFFVPGNHDRLVAGRFPITAEQRELAIGQRIPNGARDYRKWFAPIVTGELPPDDAREPRDGAELIEALRDTASEPGPIGHGYEDDTRSGERLDYTYDVVPGLVRLIAIDTADPDGGVDGLVPMSVVADFLVPELERARADGVLVLLASHHAPDDMDRFQGNTDTMREDAADPEGLQAIIASFPEVVVWLVGHSHEHRVRRIETDNGSFFEVMTGAMADYPNQSRLLEVVDNGNGTLSLFSSTVDFRAETCLERRFRRLSLIDYQSGWSGEVPSGPEDRNVELIVPAPASAETTLADWAGEAPGVIHSQALGR